jgi:energy-coupling factor transport system substrate-specific component
VTAPAAGARAEVGAGRPLLAVRWRSALVLAVTVLVGIAAFAWPFVLGPGGVSDHAGDAPWVFLVLLALMAALVVSELSSGGLDAKTVAVLGVLSAVGGALRVLGAGTAGLEPIFFLLVVSGRVLGRGAGFVLGALGVLVGAFLTGGVGPWAPFQMIAAGFVGFGAGCLPRAAGRPERVMLAAYGLVAGLAYGLVMNLWFWPFLTTGGATGTTFVPGDPVRANLARYAAFYLATSLGWDLPRGLLTAGLVLAAGRPVMASLRRGARRAAFAVEGSVVPAESPSVGPEPSDG